MKRIVVLITALAILSAGCAREKKIQPKLPAGEKAGDIPNFIMEGFNLMSTEKGSVSMEVRAKGAQIFELKKRAYAQSVKIVHYDENGKESVLTGDKAIIDTETSFMEIRGNVKGVSADGVELYTDKLFWNDKDKKMFTDAAVTIVKDGNVLKGVGFMSDAGMKNLELNKSVSLLVRDLEKDVD